METEKLTVKDAMLYPNAKVLNYTSSQDNPTEYKNIFDYIYSTGYTDGANISYTTQEDFDEYYLAECKLILRPIESLTEEEKEMITIISLETSEVFFQFDRYEMSCMEDYFITIKDKKCIDLLRSINIDIDGFIASGKAVKE